MWAQCLNNVNVLWICKWFHKSNDMLVHQFAMEFNLIFHHCLAFFILNEFMAEYFTCQSLFGFLINNDEAFSIRSLNENDNWTKINRESNTNINKQCVSLLWRHLPNQSPACDCILYVHLTKCAEHRKLNRKNSLSLISVLIHMVFPCSAAFLTALYNRFPFQLSNLQLWISFF